MNSFIIMSITAVLMALVALATTVICLAWSIPSWRSRLAGPKNGREAAGPGWEGLTGWPSSVGSVLVLLGIAVCAACAWYGFYFALAALSGGAK